MAGSRANFGVGTDHSLILPAISRCPGATP
jgi:hypothetical protein